MPKGRCTNFDEPCPKHVNEEVIEVPEGADFVCPECGRELMATSGGSSMSERVVAAVSDGKTLAASAVVLVLLGIGGWLLTGSGGDSDMSPNTTSGPPVQDTTADDRSEKKGNTVADASSTKQQQKSSSEQSGDGENASGEAAAAASEGEESDQTQKGGDSSEDFDSENGTSENTEDISPTDKKQKEERKETPINREPDCGGEKAVQNKMEYPDFAEKARIEGRVLVEFAVGEDGGVVNPQVTGGSKNRLLRRAALDAIRSLDCKPGFESGKLAKMRMELPVAFQLDEI